MKNDEGRRHEGRWLKLGAAALLALVVGCGSSGGGGGGGSRVDAGPHALCTQASADPTNCLAPAATVGPLCEATYQVAVDENCTPEAQRYLSCIVPGPGDAGPGACPDCMAENDAFSNCVVGR